MKISISNDITVVKIDQHKIGPGYPCFIIAEAGVNHNGNLDTAKRLVDIAVSAGVDAVKFQTFKTHRLVSPVAPKADYQLKNTGIIESQYDMLCRLELSPEAHFELFEYCKNNNILFMSSPFDEESVDFLDDLGAKVFKIPSGEITNLAYLDHIGEKKKPVIVSTGMANLGEIEAAVKTLKEAGSRNIVLLQCVSNYPALPENVNLRAMQTMAAAFEVPVGFSDHTIGIEVALAAVALGACIIEKHFTLDHNLPGPDHLSSLNPEELKRLVRGIRIVESALGHGRKEPAESEVNTAATARKSLVAAHAISAGTKLTEEMIAVKRPGTGLPPFLKPYLIGRRLRQTLNNGTLFSMEMLE